MKPKSNIMASAEVPEHLVSELISALEPELRNKWHEVLKENDTFTQNGEISYCSLIMSSADESALLFRARVHEVPDYIGAVVMKGGTKESRFAELDKLADEGAELIRVATKCKTRTVIQNAEYGDELNRARGVGKN